MILKSVMRTGKSLEIIATLQRGEGGEGGIRTLGTGLKPYNGLANRCLQPLDHFSKIS